MVSLYLLLPAEAAASSRVSMVRGFPVGFLPHLLVLSSFSCIPMPSAQRAECPGDLGFSGEHLSRVCKNQRSIPSTAKNEQRGEVELAVYAIIF